MRFAGMDARKSHLEASKDMEHQSAARKAVYAARIAVLLAVAALFGAWISQVRGGTLLGMSQQHLFNDAIALGVVGIALFADAYWHGRGM